MLSRSEVFAVAGLLLLVGCATAPKPGDPVSRTGDEIVVCGSRFHTGAPVVLFSDPGGFDAYRPHCFFDPEVVGPRDEPHRIARYHSERGNLPHVVEVLRLQHGGWRVEDLALVVNQIVVHYDAAGSSRRCFEILHDVRGLSSHFLLIPKPFKYRELCQTALKSIIKKHLKRLL